MGGNALSTPSRRIPRDEYLPLRNNVLLVLGHPHGLARRVVDVPAYRQKAEFGDLDVLVVWHDDLQGTDSAAHEARLYSIRQAFQTEEVVHNGGVYSFGVDGFQVDLIGCDPAPGRFEAALHYYSWNDLGNLMGRIAHKLGFKYGHRGLLLPVRDRHEHVAEEIEVSLDTVAILRFLNYNATRFYDGFDTLEDIFAYAASTSFFDPAIFQLENLNHINRLRNRKRTSYMAFVEWVARTQPGAGRDLVAEMHPDESIYRAYAYFGENELRAKIDAAKGRIERKEAVRAAFCADTVHAVVPLQGQTLGQVIAAVKVAVRRDYGPDGFDEWALTASPEHKRERVLAACRELEINEPPTFQRAFRLERGEIKETTFGPRD